MLHLIYILAFTVIAVLAIVNLIRNLLTVGMDSYRMRSGGTGWESRNMNPAPVLHPELLDETGAVVNEPLLVMRSMTVEDARERLDALYNASPPGTPQDQ